MQTLTHPTTLVRTGAVCAVLGAVVQVAAGIGSGILPAGADVEALLRALASQPSWLWPTVQLGFVLGPLFWLIAFVALTPTLPQGVSGTLAKLAAATISVGAAVHIVSSSVNGFGLATLARAWGTASATEQSNLVLMGNVLLHIMDGTWASSITLFHGLPFALSGLAVVYSRRYPALLGWLGFAGGLGSLVAGPFMFFGVEGLPVGLSVFSAVGISIYMLVLGFLMWNSSRDEVMS
ncbi:MAG: DUF4386 family protein [Ardenticatenaceae bacterium]